MSISEEWSSMVSALSLDFLSFPVSLRRNAGKHLGIGDGKFLAALLIIIIVLHDTITIGYH
jgi:hypothetical protein